MALTLWDILYLVSLLFLIYKLYKHFTRSIIHGRIINTSKNKHLHITLVDQIPTEYLQKTSNADETPILEESGLKNKTFDHIIIIIPGNPGVVEIYDHFVDTLNQELKLIKDWSNQTHCVVAVGLAGHTFNPSIRRDKNYKHYSLKEQFSHKASFVRNVHKLHPNAKIYLAGHSVGALMCVKSLMSSNVPIAKMFMLYPTIMNMHETSNAKFYGQFFRVGLKHVIAGVAHAVGQLMPTSLNELFLQFDRSSHKSDLLRPFLTKYLNYDLISNVIFLAMCEFAQILDLSQAEQDELKRRHRDIFFLFGRDDQWVPLSHVDVIDKMLSEYDDQNRRLHLHVDHEHGTRHAFVIYKEDIKIVNRFIAERITK